jgi:hypothetical protein
MTARFQRCRFYCPPPRFIDISMLFLAFIVFDISTPLPPPFIFRRLITRRQRQPFTLLPARCSSAFLLCLLML